MRGEHCLLRGSSFAPIVLIRLMMEEIMVDGHLETSICVYWVTNSIECCHVGFLYHHMVHYAESLDSLLAQVSEVFDETHPSPVICDMVH